MTFGVVKTIIHVCTTSIITGNTWQAFISITRYGSRFGVVDRVGHIVNLTFCWFASLSVHKVVTGWVCGRGRTCTVWMMESYSFQWHMSKHCPGPVMATSPVAYQKLGLLNHRQVVPLRLVLGHECDEWLSYLQHMSH